MNIVHFYRYKVPAMTVELPTFVDYIFMHTYKLHVFNVLLIEQLQRIMT
jgi:hypothetical protein